MRVGGRITVHLSCEAMLVLRRMRSCVYLPFCSREPEPQDLAGILGLLHSLLKTVENEWQSPHNASRFSGSFRHRLSPTRCDGD